MASLVNATQARGPEFVSPKPMLKSGCSTVFLQPQAWSEEEGRDKWIHEGCWSASLFA